MRQQIQRLNKTPGTEVSQGVLSSGVTQTPSMPFVQQQKTKGQRMAETFGMFTEGVQKITGAVVQDMNAKEQAYQAIEGNADGVRYSQEVIEQARELPLEQQSTFIRNKIETRLDEMRQTNVSQSYLKSYMGSFMNGAGNFDAAVNKQVWQNKKAETLTKTVSLVQQSRMAGESHNQIMQNIMNANDIDRATAGELYTNSMAMFIKEQAQNDPNYDWQTAIDKHLKINSEDGAVSYATHPKYGKIIDSLETSLTTLSTARKTKIDDEKKQQAIDTTKQILSVAYNPNSSAEELAIAKATLEANMDIFTVDQYKTSSKALDAVINNTGFASKDNPVQLAQFKAKASTGKLTLDTLELLKGNMTQKEYTAVANEILKFENTIAGTGKKALADGINDLEKAGVKLVAKTDLLGGFLEDNGPVKANAFTTQWNAYLIDYQEKNEGQLPDFTEASKKQQEIANAINTAYDTNNVGQAWDTQVSEVGAMSVDEIIKSGDVKLIQEAVKNKVINEKQTETAKIKILNTGSREQIEEAINSGLIKIEDLNPIGDQSSTAPIGIGTEAQAAESYEFDEEQMKQLENDARALLGEEGMQEIADIIELGGQLDGMFNTELEPETFVVSNPKTSEEVSGAILNEFYQSPLQDVMTEHDIIKIAHIETTLGQHPSMNKGAYQGIFQLSKEEGAGIDRTDNIANIKQALQVSLPRRHKDLTQRFKKLGINRDVTAFDLYMAHQQGARGYSEMLVNPKAEAKYKQKLNIKTNAELINVFKQRWDKL